MSHNFLFENIFISSLLVQNFLKFSFRVISTSDLIVIGRKFSFIHSWTISWAIIWNLDFLLFTSSAKALNLPRRTVSFGILHRFTKFFFMLGTAFIRLMALWNGTKFPVHTSKFAFMEELDCLRYILPLMVHYVCDAEILGLIITKTYL